MKFCHRRIPQLLFAILALLAPLSVAMADTAVPDLTGQGYLLWQQINEARRNPRAVLERLAIDPVTAQAALGDDAWILDYGLPPLAWNAQIQTVAQAHGRDMFTNLYYSQVSPTGQDLGARLIAAGYEPLAENETLAALVFTNPIPMAEAVSAMLDNMLRDELTGSAGVSRNIFSPQFSEVGVALLAESIALLDGQPYVYMLIVDFARPMTPRRFVVGVADAENRITVRNLYTGIWDVVPFLSGNAFQYPLSGMGEEFFLRNAAGTLLNNATTVGLGGENVYVDFRGQQ